MYIFLCPPPLQRGRQCAEGKIRTCRHHLDHNEQAAARQGFHIKGSFREEKIMTFIMSTLTDGLTIG